MCINKILKDTSCTHSFKQNCSKQRSKDIKHLTTASEIKSCQGHLVQKHKPQEMITQYACNKPASWPLNIRLSAAKTRFTQSKFRMLHVLHCVVLVTFAREKKEREPLFNQTLKVTFHIITSLWVVFGLSTLISYCFNLYSVKCILHDWPTKKAQNVSLCLLSY